MPDARSQSAAAAAERPTPAAGGMTHQVPASKAAETRAFAGPWLRFQSGTGPQDSTRWTGSVLCLTRAQPQPAAGNGGAAGAAQAASQPGLGGATAAGNVATASSLGAPQPTLVLTDRGAGGGSGGGERRLQPVQLDTCEGWVAWRFDLELHLADWQRAVQARLGGAAWGGRQGAVAALQAIADAACSAVAFDVGQPMHLRATACHPSPFCLLPCSIAWRPAATAPPPTHFGCRRWARPCTGARHAVVADCQAPRAAGVWPLPRLACTILPLTNSTACLAGATTAATA